MATARKNSGTTPKVVVLLATHNGMRWIAEQVASILGQTGVVVRIVALDDNSSDGTDAWLDDLANRDPRVTVLHDSTVAGSSVANFTRLMTRAEVLGDEFVAFADQDDVWQLDKLARHAALITQGGFDGVSSNVTSFTSAGARTLLRKNYPQQEFDFLAESPGPGCSFLITPRLLSTTAEALRTDPAAQSVRFHDSLIYAVCRGRGWTWHIDDYSSLDYRQHDSNVIGSNVGFRPALARLKLLSAHWLRGHTAALTRVAIRVAPEERREQFERILALVEGRGIRNRLALARMAPQLRRRPRDQRIIGLLIAIGLW
jgi:rhamnosyltransferase